MRLSIKLHPSYGPTTVWGFDGQVPGPLIQAKYGEPIVVRFQNNLPSVKTPQRLRHRRDDDPSAQRPYAN